MIARAGSGHIGSSFSSLDIVSWLFLNVMSHADSEAENLCRDIYFSSKGHDAPGFYAAMVSLERLDDESLHKLRRIDGLPGHPDISISCMETNTGSLGMGISKAKGMIFANQLVGKRGNVFVMTGDGELQEGQIWESLVSAANDKTEELTVIVDHNKLQSDTLVKKVSDLGDLKAKFTAFGWHVERCDGHDYAAMATAFERLSAVRGKPKVLIADTVKGRGVSFMEHTSIDSDVELYRFHSGAPDATTYTRAVDELIATVNYQLDNLKAPRLTLELYARQVSATPIADPQRLIKAYSEALVEYAKDNKKIIALDADLILDTGLIPFQKAFPSRFVECGIAEQDMVSQAGGMALRGLLPVVHSFACFLSARPNEQIYNNATERTKIIYVGSLAGIVPGGPGHSHQSVRDISALSAVPGLTLIEPATESEVRAAMNYCFDDASGSCYLRLVSVPWVVHSEIPRATSLIEGQGTVVREGQGVVIFAYGPVMLSEAFKAAEQVHETHRLNLRVINLPWLNRIDKGWLRSVIDDCSVVITIDNHFVTGGQGELIAATVAEFGLSSIRRVVRLGVKDIPPCGSNDQVLSSQGLDKESLVATFCDVLLR
jgi:transketolase